MKLFNKMLSTVTIASALLCAGTAQASVIDTVESNPDAVVNLTTSVFFDHDFTDQGFVTGVTNYLSGILRIRLTDLTANENGTVTLGTQLTAFGNVQNNTYNDPVDGTFVDVILNSASLADLNADGKISVAIRSTSNEFYFADSRLTVETVQANAVPEPMSIALLGAGVFGIAAARRRRKQ